MPSLNNVIMPVYEFEPSVLKDIQNGNAPRLFSRVKQPLARAEQLG